MIWQLLLKTRRGHKLRRIHLDHTLTQEKLKEGAQGCELARNRGLLFVLGVQLAAPFAAISLSVLSVFCLLFDLFHVGVYLTLGALFFFWIAVNLIIVASAARVGPSGFTPTMKIVMVLTTLFGYHAFYTNYLGWLDAAKLASPQFLAKTRDGREIPVPSNYFGIFSYTIAQTGMYIPDNHFMSRTGGNHEELDSWKEARSLSRRSCRT